MNFSQGIQVVLITVIFILHLQTTYDLSEITGNNMIVLETGVYGIYFIIVLGYLVAIPFDDELSPPLENVIKLYGAILFNVIGVSRLITFLELVRDRGFDTSTTYNLIKSLCATGLCVTYYLEILIP